jgi:glucose-1-phosphate thymidylyltransferase
MEKKSQIIGLTPAAGVAGRISPLPCSKEILPVGFDQQKGQPTLKVAGHYLLENMRSAGVRKACIVIRRGKWDIPDYFGDGRIVDMKLAYMLTPLNDGVPFTVNSAYEFIKDSIVVFGFPDIVFKPQTAFIDLVEHLTRQRVDLVLGLFNARQPSKMDMVELDGSGRIIRVDIKPPRSTLAYTWVIAVWTPVFTRFMNRFVANCSDNATSNSTSDFSVNTNEVFVGDVINAAIQEKVKMDKVIFKDGDYLDIGTPEDLARAAGFTLSLGG